MCDGVVFIIGHFDVWVVGGCTVVFGVGGSGGGDLFCGFTGFALLVLCGGFFEEGFAVAFDSLLMFLADLGWVGDAVMFVIAFHKLFGRLESR
jgi:hypothetical protein